VQNDITDLYSAIKQGVNRELRMFGFSVCDTRTQIVDAATAESFGELSATSSEHDVRRVTRRFVRKSRYADHKFTEAEKKMPQSSGRRKIGKADYQAQGVLYLPEESRFSYLLNLPEGTTV